MNPALMPPPDSICTSKVRSDALPPEGAAPSITLNDRHRVGRIPERFFRRVRSLFSALLDNSAFQEVSLGREISVIFTTNAPLVYRCRADNASDRATTAIASPKVSQK